MTTESDRLLVQRIRSNDQKAWDELDRRYRGRLTAYVRRRLKEIPVPVKVAVMGCVVNGPGECEGSDVSVFAGKGKGVIYVSNSEGVAEQVATVPEPEILDRLFLEVRKFADKVQRGEVKLKNAKVDIKPPAPIGELGSGWEKIKSEKLALPVMR